MLPLRCPTETKGAAPTQYALLRRCRGDTEPCRGLHARDCRRNGAARRPVALRMRWRAGCPMVRALQYRPQRLQLPNIPAMHGFAFRGRGDVRAQSLFCAL